MAPEKTISKGFTINGPGGHLGRAVNNFSFLLLMEAPQNIGFNQVVSEEKIFEKCERTDAGRGRRCMGIL